MNLQVNLLHAHERRSAASLRRRTGLRIVGLCIIGALLLFAAQIGFAMLSLRDDLRRCASRWNALGPAYDRVQRSQAGLSAARAQLADLAAFSNAQMRASGKLYALAGAVPSSLHLSELAIAFTPVDVLKNPGRKYEIKLIGRAYGEQAAAEAQVDALIRALQAAAPDEDGMGVVTPVRFEVVPSAAGGNKAEYDFEVRCRFEPQEVPMKTAGGKMEKRQLQILLAFGVLIAASAISLQPLIKSRARLKQKVAAEQARLADAERAVTRLPLTLGELARLDELLSTITNRYVLRPDRGSYPPKNDIYILADEMEIVGQPKEEGKLETPRGTAATNAPAAFLRYTLEVEARGSFADVINLVTVLERGNPYMGVVELAVREMPQTPEKHRVNLRLEWPVANDLPPPINKRGAVKKPAKTARK